MPLVCEARYFELLAQALRTTDDIEVAVAAADLAMDDSANLQSAAPAGGGEGGHTADDATRVTPAQASPLPAGAANLQADFGYITHPQYGRVWAGANPPGGSGFWQEAGQGPRGGKFWRRAEGYQRRIPPKKESAGVAPGAQTGGGGQQADQRLSKEQIARTKADAEALRGKVTNQGYKITDQDVDNLRKQLLSMSVREIQQFKKDFGLKASGPKAELADKVAKRALDYVQKQGGAITPAPKIQQPAPAPVPEPTQTPQPAPQPQPVVPPPQTPAPQPAQAPPPTQPVASPQPQERPKPATVDAAIDEHPDLSKNEKAVLKEILSGKKLREAGEAVFGKHKDPAKDYRERARQNYERALNKLREGDPDLLEGLKKEGVGDEIEPERTVEGVTVPKQTVLAHFQPENLTPGQRRGKAGSLQTEEGEGEEAKREAAKAARKQLAKMKPEDRKKQKEWDDLDSQADDFFAKMTQAELDELGIQKPTKKGKKGGRKETEGTPEGVREPGQSPAGSDPGAARDDRGEGSPDRGVAGGRERTGGSEPERPVAPQKAEETPALEPVKEKTTPVATKESETSPAAESPAAAAPKKPAKKKKPEWDGAKVGRKLYTGIAEDMPDDKILDAAAEDMNAGSTLQEVSAKIASGEYASVKPASVPKQEPTKPVETPKKVTPSPTKEPKTPPPAQSPVAAPKHDQLTPVNPERPYTTKTDKRGKSTKIPGYHYSDYDIGHSEQTTNDINNIQGMRESSQKRVREELAHFLSGFKEGEELLPVAKRLGTPQEQKGDRELLHDFNSKASAMAQKYRDKYGGVRGGDIGFDNDPEVQMAEAASEPGSASKPPTKTQPEAKSPLVAAPPKQEPAKSPTSQPAAKKSGGGKGNSPGELLKLDDAALGKKYSEAYGGQHGDELKAIVRKFDNIKPSARLRLFREALEKLAKAEKEPE